MQSTMKAARYYGPGQPLRLEDVPRPRLTQGEALLKVRAAGWYTAATAPIAARSIPCSWFSGRFSCAARREYLARLPVDATLVKAASVGKVAADEPVFASLFLRSLANVDPRLADCLAVTYRPGAESAAETKWSLG